MLVLVVSVFFINQGTFAQGKYTKTTDIVKSATPYVAAEKSADNVLMADMYSIDFEDEADFTFDFTPWTVVDNDLLPTYGMTGVTWPNSGDPQAFIVFNPATTDPPLTDDPEIQPHSGDKFGACLAAVPDGSNGNDDWFISDMVMVGDGASFNFWAKSYTDQYGLERFNVAVSTTTPDPAEFEVISGATYVEAPIVWTEYNYDLSAYAGMEIYVAIQCVTYDAFVFMIDDLVIDPGEEPSSCDYFDDLMPGDYVAVELDNWTTWSNNPGSAEDALISDAQSYSPMNSFLVEGTSDLVHKLADENLTMGVYYYSNMMYVPDGFCGYFNLQKDITPGVEWGFQVQFDADGMASADAGEEAAAVFPYTFDEWHMNELIVDLDNDWAEYWFDGTLMVEWQWSLGTFGTAGAITLGGANYYAWASTGNDPMCYFDDVCFEPYVPAPDCENFDALVAGDYVAGQLGGNWTTWTGTPGGADDAFVSDAQSNSPSNSFVVDDGAVDLIFKFGDDPIAEGQWLYSHYIYVPTGYSGYFNVQSEPTPGVDWNVELYFDDGGTGSIGGQPTADFTYTQDTWILVEINYDLDAGLAQILFDGSEILLFDNAMTIGCIDYYGADTGGDPGAYYDDVCFGEGWELVSVEEPAAIENSSVVYPNPATDRITIESKNIIEEVLIYNNMGQLVYSGQFDNDQIMVNTSTFTTGMYVLQIRSGENVEVRKLIIE